MKPNFLIVGGRRCGTTWLQQCLIEHPDVYMPPGRGSDIRLDEQALRGRYSGQKAIGLIDATWLTMPKGPAWLAEQHPDAQIIAILRNPVDRAYSWYLQLLKAGEGVYATEITFEEALERDPTILEEGFFYKHLIHFRKVIPPERLHILFFDDLQRDPAPFLKQVFAILNVDANFEPSVLHGKVNYSARVRNKSFHQLLRSLKRILITLTKHNLWLVQNVERLWIVETIRRLNEKRSPRMSPETRDRLVAIYAQDVAQLGELLDRDLSAWLTEASSSDGEVRPE